MTDPKHWTSAQVLQAFAVQLQNASPKAWDGFLEALDAYATEAAVALTQAPQDQILAQQGRAQQCIALLRTFREAPAFMAKQTQSPEPPQ